MLHATFLPLVSFLFHVVRNVKSKNFNPQEGEPLASSAKRSKKRRISMISAHIYFTAAHHLSMAESFLFAHSLFCSSHTSQLSALCSAHARRELICVVSHTHTHHKRQCMQQQGAGVTPAKTHSSDVDFYFSLCVGAKSLSKFLFFTMRCRLSFFLVWICKEEGAGFFSLSLAQEG